MAVFDLEADGLKPTKIHCVVYEKNGEYIALTNYGDMRKFFLSEKILIGHNIIRFDIPVIERLLGVCINAQVIDTLGISWYLEPDRNLHGLESWGETLGVVKPEIEDWQNLTIEEYVHRCTEDVKINLRLWERFKKHLLELYGSHGEADKFLRYMEFKLDCAREQERSKWKLDRERCEDGLAQLLNDKVAKTELLRKAMPRVPVFAKRTKPLKPYKKDGTFSSAGARWFSLLKQNNLGDDHVGDIPELIGEDEPNPGSPQQVKSWLYSLGWVPQTFKYDRDKNTGDIRKIPQINMEHGAGICDSIKLLYDREPSLELLDGLSVISHRISILKGFLEAVDEDGYVEAQIQGITNTLRFKHKVCVNLPKAGKPYGELIRGCLIAPEGYELCGSDMSSLEDRLKQHYIYPYDPEYVEEMNVSDYDPHLSLALSAGEVTSLQVDEYKSGVNKSIKPIRDIFKNGNYACQYGAGPARLALTANIPIRKAKAVHSAYWAKNWAIKEAARAQQHKVLKGQMWLYNPISGFWYSLRYEKDIFSTLVQGSASYVFDIWVMNVRKKRPQLTAQFHDEIVLCIKKGYRSQCSALLDNAIKETNEQLKLNRELGIGTQYAERYSDVH